MKTDFLALCRRACIWGGLLSAATLTASLEQARVNRVMNEVFIHENANTEGQFRQAQAGVDVISGEQILRTGLRSRAELLFGDESLARIGSNTVFTFHPEQREMFLGRGLILYQAKKDSGQTTRISTATATASITGTTILMEVGQRVTKIILLEGSMRVEIPGRPGEYVDLKAGQMLLFPNDATRLPDPVDIDIAHLIQTSDLVAGFKDKDTEPGESGDKLNYAELEKAWETQKQYLEEQRLTVTDLVIPGRGSTLVLNFEKGPTLHLKDLDPLAYVDGQDVITVNRDIRLPADNDNGGDSHKPDNGGDTPKPPVPPAPIVVVARPPLIAQPSPFLLGDDAEIQTNPHIFVGDAVYPGAIYYSSGGSIAQFLFGEPNAVDEAFGLTGDYGTIPHAWFRFANLQLTANPLAINVIGGVVNVGFVSESNLSVGAANYTYSPLEGLILAARDQVIFADGVTFSNPYLNLTIYHRSTQDPLVIPAQSTFHVNNLEALSGGDLHFLATDVNVADTLELHALGNLVTGVDQIIYANNIEIEAASMTVTSPLSLLAPYMQSGGSSLSIQLSGDMNLLPPDEQMVPSTLFTTMENSSLHVGGNLNGEAWSLMRINDVTVNGNATLYSFSGSNLTVGGNLSLVDSLYAEHLTVSGDWSVSGDASVYRATVGGDATVYQFGVHREVTIHGNLYGSHLFSAFIEESASDIAPFTVGGDLEGGSVGEISTIRVAGDITLDGSWSEGGYGIEWVNSRDALVLRTPRVVFNGYASQEENVPGIKGARVTRLEYMEGFDMETGGNFSVYGDEYITVESAVIKVASETSGGTLLLESENGYVHLEDNAYLQASYESGYDGSVTVKAGAPASNGVAIYVNSSAQILALAQNTSILLEAMAGDIQVDGTLQASLVEIIARGDQARVLLSSDAHIVADVLKAGSFGANGELLIGGESTLMLQAHQQLYLYANATSGTVRFIGNTNLVSNDLAIAANRVQVDTDIIVNIEGQGTAGVYANDHLYNKNGYGYLGGSYTTGTPGQAPNF